MITPYIRSSSYTAYDFCELRYFLEYVCGIKGSPYKKSTDMGSMAHKVFELLAKRKLAEQNGVDTIEDGETSDNPYHLSLLNIDYCTEVAFNHYAKKTAASFTWDKDDFELLKVWIAKALDYNNGAFNPLNQTIVMPESFFDLEIIKPWSYYKWDLPNGKSITGHLAIKGTIDLIVKHDEETYEICDLKSGRRYDWNKSKVKDYNSLSNDPQLKIYHYAASQLFPKIKHWIISINYFNDGGVISMSFNEDDLKSTEKMLEKRFTKVKNNFHPRAIYPNYKCKWCSFSKNNVNNSPVDNYGNSLCRQVRTELQQVGYAKTFEKYWKPESLTTYSGGGKELTTLDKSE